jgi:transposase-like protein
VRAPLIPDDLGIAVTLTREGRQLQARKVTEEKFDPAKKRIFLETLQRTANVTRSARAAGIAPNTAYRHKARYPQFGLAWTRALLHALDVLETMLLERALCYNASLTEAGAELGETGGGAIEPFSNGDAMRLSKLHRESLREQAVEIAAQMRMRPEAIQGRMLDEMKAIYKRIMEREARLNDAPV